MDMNLDLLTWEGTKKQINKKLNFDIIECYNPNHGIRKLRLIYYQIPAFIKSIRKYNPDYLIQTTASAQIWILMIIAKFLGIPFIHRLASDAYVDERINTLIDREIDIFLFKFGIKYSDFIFVQNDYQFHKLKEKYPKKNIFVLYNPYELITKETEILPREKRNYIAWIGNFRQIKNLPILWLILRKNYLMFDLKLQVWNILI